MTRLTGHRFFVPVLGVLLCLVMVMLLAITLFVIGSALCTIERLMREMGLRGVSRGTGFSAAS